MASGPTSWQIEEENVEAVTDFIFFGSKITVDGDCSHEIKRLLLLGRIAVTNLDSVLTSRDITLETKVRLAKMVFSVVTFRSRVGPLRRLSAKELMPSNCGGWRKLLRVPWTAWQSNQSILKEINPEYSLEGLMLKLKLQYFDHLMQRADSLKKTLMLGKIKSRRKTW